MGSSPVAVTKTSEMSPVLRKKILDIHDRVWIHSERRTWHDKNIQQIHRTDKYLQHSSIIWPVWLNSSVFFYELSGCGFEFSCIHLNFRYHTCF